MKKLLSGLVILVILGAILASGLLVWRYMTAGTSHPKSTSQPESKATESCGVPTLESVPADVILKIDSDWQPQQIQIGQTVQWINTKDEPVILESKPQQDEQLCGGFGSITLQPSQTYQLTFLRSGRWFFGLASDGVGAIVDVR